MTYSEGAAEPAWITTEATITSCRYQFASLSNLAFGFSTQQKFRITFDYYAHGQLYSGALQSPTAIPQGERIAIAYNPLHPERNSRDSSPQTSATGRRAPGYILAPAITGSLILALLWFAFLHGCG